MLNAALKEYFGNDCAFSTDTSGLYYKTVRQSNGLLYPKLELNALLVMKKSEINFRQGADELLKAISPVASGKKPRVSCRWIVCSDRGGIYLHEAIATKGNASYKNLKSRFIVVNSLDGTVSFGPGHILNGRYSDRMRALIECARTRDRARWTVDFQELVGQMYRE